MDPVSLASFGGLALPDDPQEVGFRGAIDLMNVDFDRKGRLRTRDGYVKVTADEGTNRYDSLHAFYGGTGATDTILAGAGTRLEAIDAASGAVVATDTFGISASPHRFVTFGGSAGTAVYIANGTDGLGKYTTGGGFSSPAGLSSVTGKFLAVQAPDNRLVSAKGDRVSFSAPGDPETFAADDWVDVTPGDGESITAMVSWNNLVFVFKETKFAVFTGNSTDGTGGSIFHYRVVDAPTGTYSWAPIATATTSTNGVFYADTTGVYRTTGGSPEKVTDGLQPLFDRYAPQYSSIESITAPASIACIGDRLYVSYEVNGEGFSGDRMILVHNLRTGWWTVWDVPTVAMTVLRNNDGAPATIAFAYATGLKHIAKFATTATTDDGTVIDWHYQTGFDEMGTGSVKRLRFVDVWGSGTVTCKVAKDHEPVDTGTALTLGSAPGVEVARQNSTRRGRLFSYRLSGSGPAVVNRVDLYVPDAKIGGLR